MRFVGDPVAFVVAETALQAKDAAEAVTLDIEPLPAVIKASDDEHNVLLRGRVGPVRRRQPAHPRRKDCRPDFTANE